MLRSLACISFVLAICCTAIGQIFNGPTEGGSRTAIGAIEAKMELELFAAGASNLEGASVESPSNSISKLDLKAPAKAQREFSKGYQLLLQKDLRGASEHLTKAITIYPSYVAAHNALGKTYLDLHQNQQARDEFAKAAALDDHLPSSSLNLGIAQIALKDYAAAEESLKRASSIAPLDLQLSTALAYGELMNHDYAAVIATEQEVHSRKHKGAATVHFFAAEAFEAQNKLADAQLQMQTLLQEDPKSPLAPQFRQIIEQLKIEDAMRKEVQQLPAQKLEISAFTAEDKPSAEQASAQAQRILQALREKKQIADAEAGPLPACLECATTVSPDANSLSRAAAAKVQDKTNTFAGTTFKAAVDEVAVFFAATDHGRSVTNLTPSDLEVRDNSQPPQAIVGFRNESELPLRLGLVIDTSSSVKERFAFEQEAACKFLQQVVTGKDDVAFVIGVNNSVLLVQDFTADQTLTARGINQLAPGGGTALWDAVAFAADKLAKYPDSEPVARVLVVISDGEDNSSAFTLKEAIVQAQRGEVAVYTVSTHEILDLETDISSLTNSDVGDRALKTLAELTGGTSFRPGSARRLTSSLADLQQVIRSRYLISYRPASFERNGHYRTINLTAQKDGKKLKVFARKGYYASVAQPSSANQ
jgi:Ca-activated chloride channel family protein